MPSSITHFPAATPSLEHLSICLTTLVLNDVRVTIPLFFFFVVVYFFFSPVLYHKEHTQVLC